MVTGASPSLVDSREGLWAKEMLQLLFQGWEHLSVYLLIYLLLKGLEGKHDN